MGATVETMDLLLGRSEISHDAFIMGLHTKPSGISAYVGIDMDFGHPWNHFSQHVAKQMIRDLLAIRQERSMGYPCKIFVLETVRENTSQSLESARTKVFLSSPTLQAVASQRGLLPDNPSSFMNMDSRLIIDRHSDP